MLLRSRSQRTLKLFYLKYIPRAENLTLNKYFRIFLNSFLSLARAKAWVSETN